MAVKKCPYCAEEIQPEAIKCRHCGTWLAAPPNEAIPGFEPAYGPPPSTARLVRSTSDRMIAGICGGLARSMGIDPTVVRVVVAVASFFTAIIPGLVLYAILAMVIPSDDAPPY